MTAQVLLSSMTRKYNDEDNDNYVILVTSQTGDMLNSLTKRASYVGENLLCQFLIRAMSDHVVNVKYLLVRPEHNQDSNLPTPRSHP